MKKTQDHDFLNEEHEVKLRTFVGNIIEILGGLEVLLSHEDNDFIEKIGELFQRCEQMTMTEDVFNQVKIFLDTLKENDICGEHFVLHHLVKGKQYIDNLVIDPTLKNKIKSKLNQIDFNNEDYKLVGKIILTLGDRHNSFLQNLLTAGNVNYNLIDDVKEEEKQIVSGILSSDTGKALIEKIVATDHNQQAIALQSSASLWNGFSQRALTAMRQATEFGASAVTNVSFMGMKKEIEQLESALPYINQARQLQEKTASLIAELQQLDQTNIASPLSEKLLTEILSAMTHYIEFHPEIEERSHLKTAEFKRAINTFKMNVAELTSALEQRDQIADSFYRQGPVAAPSNTVGEQVTHNSLTVLTTQLSWEVEVKHRGRRRKKPTENKQRPDPPSFEGGFNLGALFAEPESEVTTEPSLRLKSVENGVAESKEQKESQEPETPQQLQRRELQQEKEELGEQKKKNQLSLSSKVQMVPVSSQDHPLAPLHSNAQKEELPQPVGQEALEIVESENYDNSDSEEVIENRKSQETTLETIKEMDSDTLYNFYINICTNKEFNIINFNKEIDQAINELFAHVNILKGRKGNTGNADAMTELLRVACIFKHQVTTVLMPAFSNEGSAQLTEQQSEALTTVLMPAFSNEGSSSFTEQQSEALTTVKNTCQTAVTNVAGILQDHRGALKLIARFLQFLNKLGQHLPISEEKKQHGLFKVPKTGSWEKTEAAVSALAGISISASAA